MAKGKMMNIQQSRYSNEEIGRIGEEIYRRDIRSHVLPQHKGEFLVLDIQTGDYEIGADDLQTEKRLRARRPNGVLYGLRIGYTSAYTLAGRMEGGF
jgi:hypothetical protein